METRTSSSSTDLRGINQLQRGAHLAIGALAGELGGQSPQINGVFSAERLGAEPVLLMMEATQAEAEDVMRRLPGPGIGGRAQMGKVNAQQSAPGDAAAMRADPTPVPRPDPLDRLPQPNFRALPAIGQSHVLPSSNRAISPLPCRSGKAHKLGC